MAITAGVAALLCFLPAAEGQSAAGTSQSDPAATQTASQIATQETAQAALPSAPVPNTQTPSSAAPDATGASAQTDGTAQTTGTISGTVTDTQGALVSGAEVTLTGDVVEAPRKTMSRPDGTYFFEKVHAGAFHLTAVAEGMNKGEITGTIAAGGVYLAPPIQLGTATSSSEVTVTPQTEKEIATQQVQQEEKQRVLGILPNYFVTYVKNPAPLDAQQKFNLGVHDVLDPVSFLLVGGIAGAEQMVNLFPGYGSGPAAYGKRYGAALADATVGTMFRDSIYPSLFHQDPRYFYLGEGTTWHRTKYALETSVICKGDNGKWQTNYSGILGSLTAGAMSNLYYAPSDRQGALLTVVNSLIGVAGEGVAHLLQEFVLRDLTTNAPKATP